MFELAQFIDECRSALDASDPTLAIRQIMSEVVTHPQEIEAALGPADPTQRETPQYSFLHQSQELTVLRVVMPELLRSPPHNHMVWAVIGLYMGCENNVFYGRAADRIEEIDRRDLVAPEVLVLSADTIHGISNPLAQRSFALHVYGGALANPTRSLWNPFTRREEPFQLSALMQYEREMTLRVGRDAAKRC